jgi:hypothetical protein
LKAGAFKLGQQLRSTCTAPTKSRGACEGCFDAVSSFGSRSVAVYKLHLKAKA